MCSHRAFHAARRAQRTPRCMQCAAHHTSSARVTGEAYPDMPPLAMHTCARGRRLSAFDLFLRKYAHGTGPDAREPARANQPALLRLRPAAGLTDVTVLSNVRVERLCFETPARASAPRVNGVAVRFGNSEIFHRICVSDKAQVRPPPAHTVLRVPA